MADKKKDRPGTADGDKCLPRIAGYKNLQRFDTEAARIAGKKGADACAKSRRVKKTLRTMAVEMLTHKIKSEDLTEEQRAALDFYGVSADDFCPKAQVVIGMIAKAASGDPAAFDRVAKICGEDDITGDDSVKISVHIGGAEKSEEKEKTGTP